ncbi:hypothetical protein NNL21_09695 [Paenibacillus mendelii]|nr:hypothetical protein [Paenibacillus mendelii]
MTQVLFALNERYFYGDKKLESLLKGLSFCPPVLTDHHEFLLTARKDISHLKRQRDVLAEAAAHMKNYMEDL